MRTNPPSFDFPQTEPSLRTAEVARALGVSARAIRTWADEGKIACYRTFGGHRLFTASEVRRVLASWGGVSEASMDDPGVFAVADRAVGVQGHEEAGPESVRRVDETCP